jgi:hypothetical protein
MKFLADKDLERFSNMGCCNSLRRREVMVVRAFPRHVAK